MFDRGDFPAASPRLKMMQSNRPPLLKCTDMARRNREKLLKTVRASFFSRTLKKFPGNAQAIMALPRLSPRRA
ncbi:hypothetical protein [Herbaspirillum sp. CF444]|uniref:hypothetical protein n=1 Tax=Herbaspirillum sp. CF444 TaxID=1144319 RepID=UPI000553EF83|nr:hypothetical protein [Herbaspirillum sp. CF444]